MSAPARGRVLAFDGRLGAHRPIVSDSPVISSAGRDWRGFLFELHHVGGQELLDVEVPHTIVGLHLGMPTKVEIKVDGPFVEKVFQPGDVTIIPAGSKCSIRFAEQAEFVIISLDPELLSRASQAVHGDHSSRLPVIWRHRDQFISETIQNIRLAVEQPGQIDRTYAETLANSLAMHLVRNFDQTKGHPTGRKPGGLSRAQLERTLELIRNTPYRDISLRTMSAAAGLSPFHFARMFKLSTGLSPHQFVLKRRLEIGTIMLTTTGQAISEIASGLGFADQSHFTMHFKRANGVAPAAYRRQHRR
jgi:AraC family transcriptional regulator